jgi:predicted transglutaminase-like cysteine proteinase
VSATDQTAAAIEPDADGIDYRAASASEIRSTPSGRVPAPNVQTSPLIALSRSWRLASAPGAPTPTPEPQRAADAPRAVAQSSQTEALFPLDRENWALLNRVNRSVNRSIRQASDQSVFGQADYWQAPTRAGAYGDCEDYVLAKRQALIAAGVPAAALSIAIVETRWGESHAVLLVAGNTGEVVLDSLSSWISRWDRVDYTWRERQAPGQVFEWVTISA